MCLSSTRRTECFDSELVRLSSTRKTGCCDSELVCLSSTRKTGYCRAVGCNSGPIKELLSRVAMADFADFS